MNILIPNSWLREYLDTNATPEDIKRCLSLSGPSVERITIAQNEPVYDIEITTNRVDAFSIYGIAREASVILPRFKFKATLKPFPKPMDVSHTKKLELTIKNDPKLVRRILAIKIENVQLRDSPEYIQKRLELVGQRPINNLVDITNYVMWEVGHPCHVFDYDRFPTDTIIVRAAKKGEKVVTLDGKLHTMVGGEIVFDDGNGIIIDVPGIMGTANTVVTNDTKNVLLFIENSDPKKIRFASMTHAIRSHAAIINEKDPDPILARTAMDRAITLCLECTAGNIGSSLYDEYPAKHTSHPITVPMAKLSTYLNTTINEQEISSILTPLGFDVTFQNTHKSTHKGYDHADTTEKLQSFIVTPPSWRTRDITIAEDVIEEIARIYGYHSITPRLPEGELLIGRTDPELEFEDDLKIRLRDYGYTEMMTYSMISETLMDTFRCNKNFAYKIANPLSDDWMYMRPHLTPSMLMAIAENLSRATDVKTFELSMVYEYQKANLPKEIPMLLVVWTGDQFLEAKGLSEILFDHAGIRYPSYKQTISDTTWYTEKQYDLGKYGSFGILRSDLLHSIHIHIPITQLYINISHMVTDRNLKKAFRPIPKFPPSFEDLALIIPPKTPIAHVMETIRSIDRLVVDVTILDRYKNINTVHITYQDDNKNLTDLDIRPIRQKILAMLLKKHAVRLKE